MQKIVRIEVLFFLVFMLLFQLPSTGQNKKLFVITGKIIPEIATTESGSIQMSKSGAPATKIDIPKNNRFRLELEYFNEYTLTFNLNGFFSKTIIVSTEIPQEVWQRDSDFPAFPMIVQLFKEIEGIDKSFTLKASGKIFYGKQTDNFEKESYFSDVQMAEQIETAKTQTGQVEKEAHTITKQEAQDLAVKQNNFDQLIKEADALYKRGEYKMALIKYLEAKQLFPEKAYANDRIAELQDLVKALQITEKQKTELEQKYKDAIARANGFFDRKTYQEARPVYEEALQYKPGDVFSNGRIKEIDELLALLEKQKQYNDLIAQADNNFKSKNFDQAIPIYNQAKQLVPENEYPQKQLDLINQEKQKLGQTEAKLAQLAKMTQAYNKAINDANRFVGDKRYKEAKEKYQEALQYLPDSDYPKRQIEKLDELLAQADAERQTEELFASSVKEGETLFKNKEYTGARLSFVKATELKPAETLPVRRIQEIDKALADLALAEAKNKATESGYQEAISRADKALAGKEYSSARLIYGEALSIKPNEQYPKDKIAEIDLKMADLKIQQYNQAIAAGDLALKADQLDEAAKQYELALASKANDPYAQKQLAEIAKRRAALLAEKAGLKKLDDQYKSLMADAYSNFKNKEYLKAKEKYQNALLLKPAETLPKEQIAKIDGLLKEELDAAETDRLYSESVKAGQEAFRQNKLKEARDAYLKAHDLKPSEVMPPIRIAEINLMIKQLEETARLAALEEAQRLAKEKADKEQYDKAIALADQEFAGKEYKKARTHYTSALSVLPTEKYPKDQINIIDELIAKQEEINMFAKQKAMKDSIMKVRDDAFNRAISLAKELEQSKQYQNAILKYKEAIVINPDKRNDVQKFIVALEDQLKLIESQDKQYQQAIAQADQLYADAKLEEALTEYRNAANIKTTEEYPKKRIVEIQGIISERNANYDNAIKSADKAFNESDWQKAKAGYTEALAVKPNELYPEKRLKEVEQKILDAKLADIGNKAESVAYNEAVAKAEKAFLDNQLTTAKMHFNVAQSLKPTETLPPRRIKEIDVLIEQRNKERLAQLQRDIDEKYRQSISVADNAFREKTYSIARLRYQEAQLIKPDEPYPKNQITLIDKLLNEAKPVETYAYKLPEMQTAKPTAAPIFNPVESAQATEARAQSFKTVDNYDEAISKADGSFGIKDYTVARFYYYKASDLKPSEEYPKNQIELIRKLVDSELSSVDRSGYDEAISQADDAFSKKNYTIAKFYYYKALEIKSWEKYPKDRIAEIMALTNSLLSEKEEKEYRDIIARADEAYFNKDIAIARFYYNKAIAIKTDENYPRIKLKDIQKLIYQDNQDHQNLDYNKLIELADQALQSENYNIARFNYNKALNMKPDDKYPKDQLRRIKEALEKQNKQ